MSSTTSFPKCTATEKKDLTVAVGNRLAKRKVKGVNAIKAKMLEALVEKNEKGRARFLRLNKAAEKALLSCVKDQNEDVQGDVQTAVSEFREILGTKPKQLLSAYMKFSVAQTKSLANVKDFGERSQKIKAAWAKLSDKKKDSYKPSKNERTAYEEARATYTAAIKSFKKKD